jgi:hypothetical protein
MAGEVEHIESKLAAVVANLNPSAIDSATVVPLFERFDRIERLASSAKTLLARRLEDTEEWKRSGYLSPAEFVASKSGSSISAAKDTLATSEKVVGLPMVEQALRAGELSGPQAAAVADAAARAPREQRRLVSKAKKASLRELREECGRTKAAADPSPEVTDRRIHAGRHVRTFTDAEGAWNLHARGTVAHGARIEAALRPFMDAQFDKARREGRREPLEAYAFDALVEALDQPAAPTGTKRENLRYLGLLRVDLEALQRDHVGDGEYCEITGIGPIPVSTARKLLGESILKLVITKGVDVLHVTHLGRGPTAAQLVALLWQNALCIVEGCDRTHREVDHREDWAKTKHTRLDELELPCDEHHDLKTRHGWALVEGTGKRPMVPPDDPRHPNNKPPP